MFKSPSFFILAVKHIYIDVCLGILICFVVISVVSLMYVGLLFGFKITHGVTLF